MPFLALDQFARIKPVQSMCAPFGALDALTVDDAAVGLVSLRGIRRERVMNRSNAIALHNEVVMDLLAVDPSG